MTQKRGKSSGKTLTPVASSDVDPDRFPIAGRRSSISMDDDLIKDGDFKAVEEGHTLGAIQPSGDDEVERFGSREETNAALEGKIALQNTRRLHGRF